MLSILFCLNRVCLSVYRSVLGEGLPRSTVFFHLPQHELQVNSQCHRLSLQMLCLVLYLMISGANYSMNTKNT